MVSNGWYAGSWKSDAWQRWTDKAKVTVVRTKSYPRHNSLLCVSWYQVWTLDSEHVVWLSKGVVST